MFVIVGNLVENYSLGAEEIRKCGSHSFGIHLFETLECFGYNAVLNTNPSGYIYGLHVALVVFAPKTNSPPSHFH